MRSLRTSLLPPSLLVLAIFAGVAGCGRRDPFGREPIKGTVSLEGKPVQFGVLTLEPAEGQLAGATAPIRDGRFDIPKNMGPCPGKYKVWVQVLDRSGEVPPGTPIGQEGPPPKNILPEKYRKGPIGEITVEKITTGTSSSDHVIDIR